jgi:elongation factor P
MIAKDIKTGAILNYLDAPCVIETISVQSPSARGAATLYKYRARNLVTKQKVDITLKGGESLPEADFHRRPVKLMYADASDMHFLDEEDFNQFTLPLADVAEEAKYLTERLEGVQMLIYNDQAVGLQVPPTVELVIAECDPAVRGNSATGRTKAAKLETGLVVQVPEYLSTGETIKVDSRTAQFVSRA